MRLALNFWRHCALAVLAAFIAFSVCCPPVLAQDQTNSPPQTAAKKSDADPPAATPERKKTKKVWTNENMGEVSASPVSQVGHADATSTSPEAASKNATSASARSAQLIAAYRKQLNTLQAQQASVEKQIADLKDFNRGEAGHDTGMQLHKRYSTEPIDEQIRKLEAKRKQLADQIDALLTSARKSGIESGQLR